jgi:hypothetical protein
LISGAAAMYPVSNFVAGGYRYIPSVFQYSAGVAAESGFRLEQARFKSPVPIQNAFAIVERHLTQIGRPFTAFAHCELRSPGQFDDNGFIEFNKRYVGTLQKWGIYQSQNEGKQAINPVARTNVCPEFFGPQEISMLAFTYTVPCAMDSNTNFVVSGGGDARPGSEPYKDRIIAYGDHSQSGLQLKVEFVIQEMEKRLKSLGFTWNDVACTQAYSVHNIGGLVESLLASRGFMRNGLSWYFARPPVMGLDFEMDLRGAVNQVYV